MTNPTPPPPHSMMRGTGEENGGITEGGVVGSCRHQSAVRLDCNNRSSSRGMLLCRGSPEESLSGSVPVYLNVYDLTPVNGYAYWLGLGVYHSGVQVLGVEYAYGAHEYPSTGIFEAEPQRCEGFTFRKSILIGKTDMGPTEVRTVMEGLSEFYRGNTYHLITKNCNHFCNDACVRLTRNPIPSWVNRLARIGFFCNCVLPASLCSTKVRHHKMEEKVLVEEERTKSTDVVTS